MLAIPKRRYRTDPKPIYDTWNRSSFFCLSQYSSGKRWVKMQRESVSHWFLSSQSKRCCVAELWKTLLGLFREGWSHFRKMSTSRLSPVVAAILVFHAATSAASSFVGGHELSLNTGEDNGCKRNRMAEWWPYKDEKPAVGLTGIDWAKIVENEKSHQCWANWLWKRTSRTGTDITQASDVYCNLPWTVLCSKLWFRIQNAYSRIQNQVFQNPESRIQYPEFRISNSEFQIQNSDFRLLYACGSLLRA